MASARWTGRRSRGSLVPAGLVLGAGLGAFVDGILLHQVLQWHHMVTAHDMGRYAPTTVEALKVNTLWDGVFHSAAWAATLAGVVMLWLAGRNGARWSARVLGGGMLAGWGLFNLVEGLVDHHILGLHHVRDDLGGPVAWDLGFLGLGLALVVAGGLLVRAGREPRPTEVPQEAVPAETPRPRRRRGRRRGGSGRAP